MGRMGDADPTRLSGRTPRGVMRLLLTGLVALVLGTSCSASELPGMAASTQAWLRLHPASSMASWRSAGSGDV